jgi:hypothetical protein
MVHGILQENLYPGDAAFARDLKDAIDHAEGVRARKPKTPRPAQPRTDEEDLISIAGDEDEANDLVPPETPRFQVPESVPNPG